MLKNKLTRQFFAYCAIGVLNTVVHYAVFAATLMVINSQALANTFAFGVAVTVSFFLNSKITFKKKTSFFRFLKLALASGFVALIFGAMGDIFALHPTLTFVAYVLVNPVIGFLLAKFFVFK